MSQLATLVVPRIRASLKRGRNQGRRTPRRTQGHKWTWGGSPYVLEIGRRTVILSPYVLAEPRDPSGLGGGLWLWYEQALLCWIGKFGTATKRLCHKSLTSEAGDRFNTGRGASGSWPGLVAWLKQVLLCNVKKLGVWETDRRRGDCRPLRDRKRSAII